MAIHVVQVWSVYVTLMGIYWATGGAGYPLGDGDPKGFDSGSILVGLDASIGGPTLVVVGLLGLGLVTLLERADPRTTAPRRALILAGAAYACVLVAVGVDSRTLMLLPPLGLLPIKWAEADWPTLFQVAIPVVAAGFIVATVDLARRTEDRSPAGLDRAAAHSRTWDRVGRIAAYIAMVTPLPYAVIRVCWSRGWAVGAPEPYVEHVLRTQPENVWIEPILASFAVTGAVLTSGLLARWGRIFPAWLPVVGGRRVPLWFPLGLGGSAAIAIWSFGRGLMLGRLGVEFPSRLSDFQQWGLAISGWEFWGVDGLGWLFPLWAVSLAIALVGYYHRRRLEDHHVEQSGRKGAQGQAGRLANRAVTTLRKSATRARKSRSAWSSD